MESKNTNWVKVLQWRKKRACVHCAFLFCSIPSCILLFMLSVDRIISQKVRFSPSQLMPRIFAIMKPHILFTFTSFQSFVSLYEKWRVRCGLFKRVALELMKCSLLFLWFVLTNWSKWHTLATNEPRPVCQWRERTLHTASLASSSSLNHRPSRSFLSPHVRSFGCALFFIMN